MSLLQALKLTPPPNLASSPATAAKGAPAAKASAAPKTGKLTEAAEAWRQTHRQADERIAALKAAVKSHCADAPPALLQEIEKGLVKLDEVLATVDHRLADSLANAGKAADDAAQKAELDKAKAILTEYINYVKGATLVAHVDQNPFNVKTDLKGLLAGGLTQAAKVIG
ncbi:MAG: hypothetical protein K8R60_24600 [Burkholderiales bacterium]|nr:hypothetical protein [Burkholderiales bacterium]